MPDVSDIPPIEPIDFGEDGVLQLEDYLKKPYDDISEAQVELPAIIEWLNVQLQNATVQTIISNQETKRVKAEAFINLRNGGFEEQYSGKMTDKALSAAVDMDERVNTAFATYAGWAGWKSRLQNALKSFDAKLELLRTSEATRRRIFESDQEDDATED